jgi:hypothetical protein
VTQSSVPKSFNCSRNCAASDSNFFSRRSKVCRLGLGGPAVDDFRYNAIAVVVAKLSRQAIRPLAKALAL